MLDSESQAKGVGGKGVVKTMKETFGNNFVISHSRLEIVPLLNPSFNAQPQAPAQWTLPERSKPAPAAGR